MEIHLLSQTSHKKGLCSWGHRLLDCENWVGDYVFEVKDVCTYEPWGRKCATAQPRVALSIKYWRGASVTLWPLKRKAERAACPPG